MNLKSNNQNHKTMKKTKAQLEKELIKVQKELAKTLEKIFFKNAIFVF